jgi:hypothetical protein
VAVIVIVTGLRPQLNRMMPPLATAATTAAEVQLAGVPRPTTRLGWEVSTARASAGMAARPAGLPKEALAAAPVRVAGAGFVGATAVVALVAVGLGEGFADAADGLAVVVSPEPSGAAGAGADSAVAGSDTAADEDGDGACPQALRVAAPAAIRTRRAPGRCRTRAT